MKTELNDFPSELHDICQSKPFFQLNKDMKKDIAKLKVDLEFEQSCNSKALPVDIIHELKHKEKLEVLKHFIAKELGVEDAASKEDFLKISQQIESDALKQLVISVAHSHEQHQADLAKEKKNCTTAASLSSTALNEEGRRRYSDSKAALTNNNLVEDLKLTITKILLESKIMQNVLQDELRCLEETGQFHDAESFERACLNAMAEVKTEVEKLKRQSISFNSRLLSKTIVDEAMMSVNSALHGQPTVTDISESMPNEQEDEFDDDDEFGEVPSFLTNQSMPRGNMSHARLSMRLTSGSSSSSLFADSKETSPAISSGRISRVPSPSFVLNTPTLSGKKSMITVDGFGTLVLSVENGGLSIEQVGNGLLGEDLFEEDEMAPEGVEGDAGLKDSGEVEHTTDKNNVLSDMSGENLKTRLDGKQRRNSAPRLSAIEAAKINWKKASSLAQLLQAGSKKDKPMRVERSDLPPPIRSLLSSNTYVYKFQALNSTSTVGNLVSMVLTDTINVDEIDDDTRQQKSYFFMVHEDIESFPEMVMSFFLKRYGLPPIAERNLISLFISISNQWDANPRLRLISRFFGISQLPTFPPEASSYYFYLVTEFLLLDVEHRDYNRFKEVLRTKR